MGRVGFEPTKDASPTDLQSVPIDHSGIYPIISAVGLEPTRLLHH